MKEEVQSWFQGLGYGEGFGLSEIPPAEVKKWQIDIHVILSEVIHEERRKIFCEGIFFVFFYMCGCIMHIAECGEQIKYVL